MVCTFLRVTRGAYIADALERKLPSDEAQMRESLAPSPRNNVTELPQRRRYVPGRKRLREDVPRVAEPEGTEGPENG